MYNIKSILVILFIFCSNYSNANTTQESYQSIYNDINTLSNLTAKDIVKFDINFSNCNSDLYKDDILVSSYSCNYSSLFIDNVTLDGNTLHFYFKNKVKDKSSVILSKNLTLISSDSEKISIQCLTAEKCFGLLGIYADINYTVSLKKLLSKHVLNFEQSISNIAKPEATAILDTTIPRLVEENSVKINTAIQGKVNSLESSNETTLVSANHYLENSIKYINNYKSKLSTSLDSTFLQLTDVIEASYINEVPNLSSFKSLVESLTNGNLNKIDIEFNNKLNNHNFLEKLPPINCNKGELLHNWNGSSWVCRPKYYTTGVTLDPLRASMPILNVKSTIASGYDYTKINHKRYIIPGYIVVAKPATSENLNRKDYKPTCSLKGGIDGGGFQLYSTYGRSRSKDVPCRFYVAAKGYSN